MFQAIIKNTLRKCVCYNKIRYVDVFSQELLHENISNEEELIDFYKIAIFQRNDFNYETCAKTPMS